MTLPRRRSRAPASGRRPSRRGAVRRDPRRPRRASRSRVDEYDETWRCVAHRRRPDQARRSPSCSTSSTRSRERARRCTDDEFPFVLSAGERRSSTANTIFRDPAWRKKDARRRAADQPDDAAAARPRRRRPGAGHDRRGSAEAAVEVTDMMQPGHVSLPNGSASTTPTADGDAVFPASPPTSSRPRTGATGSPARPGTSTCRRGSSRRARPDRGPDPVASPRRSEARRRRTRLAAVADRRLRPGRATSALGDRHLQPALPRLTLTLLARHAAALAGPGSRPPRSTAVDPARFRTAHARRRSAPGTRGNLMPHSASPRSSR